MLEFEQDLIELEDRIQGLKTLPSSDKIQDEIQRLEKKSLRLLRDIYTNLTPWQKVLVARHPDRPKGSEYIQRMIVQFIPLAGDRLYGEDLAIKGGIGFFKGRPVVIMAHEKGHDTASRVTHNFGMAHPEGYRKVKRLMDLADQFSLPVIMLVDTPGAYAGVGAEERGQSEAIASCIEKSLTINVPVLSVIIGEGGSGGAVAMATSNYIGMLENSVYSVISPEGCASILWRTADKKQEAAVAQKLTSKDLKELGIVDEIIPEPMGGAQRNKIATIDSVAEHLEAQLRLMDKERSPCQKRRQKFMTMGQSYLKPRRS